MQQLKKIAGKILFLITDILFLAYKTGKQIVLPSKKQNGNILSSLLIFFLGCIEKLNQFEHGIFKMTSLFKLRYLKAAIIIIASFLFFLSSFEWTSNKQSNGRNLSVTSKEHKDVTQTKKFFNKQDNVRNSVQTFLIPDYSTGRKVYIFFYQASVKKYLLIRSLRI